MSASIEEYVQLAEFEYKDTPIVRNNTIAALNIWLITSKLTAAERSLLAPDTTEVQINERIDSIRREVKSFEEMIPDKIPLPIVEETYTGDRHIAWLTNLGKRNNFASQCAIPWRGWESIARNMSALSEYETECMVDIATYIHVYAKLNLKRKNNKKSTFNLLCSYIHQNKETLATTNPLKSITINNGKRISRLFCLLKLMHEYPASKQATF
jgi:hypothetical protein